MTAPPARSNLTVLNRIVNLIPLPIVNSAAGEAGVDLKARVFTPFPHLVTMLFALLSLAKRRGKAAFPGKVFGRSLGHLQARRRRVRFFVHRERRWLSDPVRAGRFAVFGAACPACPGSREFFLNIGIPD